MKKKLPFLFISWLMLGCSFMSTTAPDICLKIDEGSTFQTIHNFGASDAWSCQFIGKYWPERKKEKMAEWLFSQEINLDGSPKGIGLSTWRFNIGAGSNLQHHDNGIQDIWRKAETFYGGDKLIEDAQAGQRWFLSKAKQYGVNEFIGFVNSPPVFMTKNGFAYSSGGESSNLSKVKYADYANYLCDVHELLNRKDGVYLSCISPINEPQWDWKGGQEGSPWTNAEIAELSRVLDSVITHRELSFKIDLTEAGKLNYLYQNDDKPVRGSQIFEFWNKKSPNYIGSLTHLAPKVSAHGYFTTYPDSTLLSTRKQVLDTVEEYENLEFWMSEYCMLENNERIQGSKRDLGMDAALYMAKVIHADLVEANASSWQWWLAISPYDYKDGLIYTKNDTLDGDFHSSKMLWTLGNYSRFIQPGSQRVNLSIEKGNEYVGYDKNVLVSAYKSKDHMSIVLINQADRPYFIKTDNQEQIISAYVTDKNNDLKALKVQSKQLLIPSRSITTLILK